MKRFICVLLIALLCVGLAACGSKSDNASTADSSTASPDSSSTSSSAETQASAVTEAPDADPASSAASSSTSSAASSSASASSGASGTSEKAFASIQDYLNSPEVQAEVNSAIESSKDNLSMKVYAEGDTLVYDYTLTESYNENQLASIKESLDSSLEEKSSSFESVVNVLKTNVNVENPKVKVVYRSNDDTVITERTYE